jgi:hypothetical protein
VKNYALTSGTIFALVAALHVFVTYEHWRAAPSDVGSVLAPAVVCTLAAALAIWAFRVAHRA